MIKTARWPLVTVYVCLCVAICTRVSFAACPTCEDERLCGPRCMLAICQKLRVDTNFEELVALCGTDARGSSLAGLRDAAVAKGFEAIGVKTGIDELATFQGFVIAHLWNNHFVVVEPGDENTVKMTDPPNEPKTAKMEDFKKAYSGFALLIAKDASAFPTSKAEGPDLRFDAYTWDFGSVMRGETQEHLFKCRNVGNADLVISKVEASCSECVIPLAWPQTIRPGGEGEIRALLVTANQWRGLAKKLYVTSNDPISPVVHLEVTGYVRPDQLVMSPRTVDFANPRRTEIASREVFIPSTPEDSIDVKSIESGSPFVTTSLAPSTLKGLSGYIITTTLKPGAPVGEFKSKLTIHSSHPKQPKVEIPVTAMIKGDIDVFPDTLFFGVLKKGEAGRKKVNITTQGQQPFSIDSIDNPMPDHLMVRSAPVDGGKGYTLTAILRRETLTGYINGVVVTVHTNNPDQPEIRIPVYAAVED